MANSLLTELDKARIGQRLAIVRRIADKTQDDFARDAGITRTAYNNYENGVKTPSLEAATRLCMTYDLTLDYIYHGDTSGLRRRVADAITAIADVTKPD